MKKLLFILSFLFCFIVTVAQNFVTRTTGSITPVDMRLKAGLNFYVPVASDTTLNGGKDSLGALIYSISLRSLFLRDTIVGGGKKWTKLLEFGETVLYTDTTAMLAPYPYNFSNGLTKTGKSVVIGGILTQATTIDAQNNSSTNFIFANQNFFAVRTAGYRLEMPPTGSLLSLGKIDGTVGFTTSNNANYSRIFAPGHEITASATGINIYSTDSVTMTGTGISTTSDTSSFKPLVRDANGKLAQAASWQGSVSLANNGLSKSGDTVQLGGTLTKNTVLNNSSFVLSMTGTATAQTFSVANTGTGKAILASSIDQNAIDVSSINASAIGAVSTNGVGISISSTNNLAGQFSINPSSTNTVVDVLQLTRNTQGTPANGIGQSIVFYNQAITGGGLISNRIISKWTDAIEISRKSAFEIWGIHNTTLSRKILIASTGQLTLDGYPSLTQQTDTTNIKPLGYNISNGQMEPMANWVGSGAVSGVTTMQPVGTTPNPDGATISVVNLTLQPTDGVYPGVITTDTQTVAGNKNLTGKTTNFYGFAPRIGSNWLPATKLADSLYQANEYLAFGFMAFLAGGTYVHVYAHADNHVGNNSRIKMRRSHDGGRVWDGPTTIDTATGSTLVSGIGGGVSRKNTIIVFDNTFTLSGSDQTMTGQRVLRSEDGGQTFSAPITIPFNSETVFQPYGPLVNGANGDMFLTWYGFTGSTFSSYIIKSTDDGLTWGSPVTIVSNTTSQRTETSVAWLGGEDYVALARSEVNDTLYGQFISHDGCATWSYQGQVSFGIKGTPAWLSRIITQNGRLAIEACYRDGTLGGGFFVNAIYGYADSILLGPSGWDLNTEVKIFDSLDGSGYVSVAHPYDEMYGLATVFDETLAQADATLKFFSQPKGNNFPIGVSTGISGLTTNRLIVATGASSIGDYENFKINNTSGSIILGGVTGNTWSAHNGGVIDGGKSSLLLSNDGFPALLNNAYLDGTYKYHSNGFASGVILDAGQFYFVNAPAGTAGDNITWNTRMRIGTSGDLVINGSAGAVDQVLVSAGSGVAASWQTFLSSQWMNVTTDDINYSGDNVGIHTVAPLSPLHITDNLTATTDRSLRIVSNNNNVGGSIFLSCNLCGTGNRGWSVIADGNGFNFMKDGDTPSPTPSTKMLINHNGETQIGSLTDQGAYTLQITGGFYQGGLSRFTDTGRLDARFSYNTNIGNTFTLHSLVDKNYVDSIFALGSGDTTALYLPLIAYAGSGSDPDTIGIAGLTTLGTAGQSIRINAGGTGFEYYTPSSGGVTTMANIGSSPNADGATISGSTLTLQPASGSFGGVLTTGAQTVAGDKTLTGLLNVTNNTILIDGGAGKLQINDQGGGEELNITHNGQTFILNARQDNFGFLDQVQLSLEGPENYLASTDDGYVGINVGLTPAAYLDLDSSTTAAPSLRLRPGVNPSSPLSGAIWWTGTVLNVYDGSATQNLLIPTVLRGGTGQSSYTNGQLLIGNTTGNTLTKATLTEGAGISITNGTGSITVAIDGSYLSSSTYNPTITNGANVTDASVQGGVFYYSVIGNQAHVWGTLSIDPTTTTTLTVLDIELPITSSITSVYEITGRTQAKNTSQNEAGWIDGNNVGGTARLTFFALSAAATDHVVDFWVLVTPP